MVMTCVQCESEFGLIHGKPGKINECPSCATDIPVYWAEMGTGDDGTVETMTVKPIEALRPLQNTVIHHWVKEVTELGEDENERTSSI